MSVNRGLLALLEAKPGKGEELAAFLERVAPCGGRSRRRAALASGPGQRHDLRRSGQTASS